MLRKTIKFKNLDEQDVEETFYFALSKVELAKLDAKYENVGGLSGALKHCIETRSGKRLMDLFEDLIGESYGKRHEDGKQFEKSETILKSFLQTDAYTVLFEELVTEAGAAINFIRGVVPSGMVHLVDQAATTGVADLGLPAEVSEAITKDLAAAQLPAPVSVQEERPGVLQISTDPSPADGRVTAQGIPLPPQGGEDTRPIWMREGRVPTKAELAGASIEELQAAFAFKEQSGS